MGRIIAAVALGYIAIGALVVATDQLFAAVIPGFKSMAMPPLYYFVISLGTDFLYSIVGGYLCSVIARARDKTATLALIVFGELIGVVSQIALWKTVPHWFGFGLLILYPPAIWIGYLLRSRSQRSPLKWNAA
jgi:hypothetical protein